MAAVAPRSSGRELGDLELDFAEEGDALELECMPSSHGRREAAPPPMLPPALARDAEKEPGLPEAPPPSRSMASSQRAIDPHAALAAFAGFGDPPATVWGTPAYAMRVIARRRVLRASLLRARALRSRDVGLYEAALGVADQAAVRKGILFVLVAVAIVVVIGAQWITDAVPLPW